jgi:hypothetical protein
MLLKSTNHLNPNAYEAKTGFLRTRKKSQNLNHLVMQILLNTKSDFRQGFAFGKNKKQLFINF